jgi:hypothetical protein
MGDRRKVGFAFEPMPEVEIDPDDEFHAHREAQN